jgi:hypothetical protein
MESVMCISCTYFDKKLVKSMPPYRFLIYPCPIYPKFREEVGGWYMNIPIDCPEFIPKEQTNNPATPLPIDEKILSNIDQSLSEIAYELRTANKLKAWEMKKGTLNPYSDLGSLLINIIAGRRID